MTAHEIDYHIYGEEMQYVEIELDPQEVVVAEAGSFMMMENGIKMETNWSQHGIMMKTNWHQNGIKTGAEVV